MSVEGWRAMDGWRRAAFAGIVRVRSGAVGSADAGQPCCKCGRGWVLNLSGMTGTSGSSARRIVDSGDWLGIERLLPVELMALGRRLIAL